MGKQKSGLARFLYRLRYMFVMNIDNKVGHFQGHLETVARLPDPAPFTVRTMDLADPQQIQDWMEIIADAYGEAFADPQAAVSAMKEHLFLNVFETVFLCDADRPIGAVSIGTYKEKPHVGGLCRLAVREEYQGRSLGKFMRLLGYHTLYDRGIRYGEGIISAKRDKSIMMIYFCGFKPQHNMKYVSYTGHLENINWFQRQRIRRKLERLYREFEQIRDQRFLSNYGAPAADRQEGANHENSGAGGRL